MRAFGFPDQKNWYTFDSLQGGAMTVDKPTKYIRW